MSHSQQFGRNGKRYQKTRSYGSSSCCDPSSCPCKKTAGHEAQLIINDIANTYVTLSRCMTLSELTVSQIDPKAPTHAISTKNRGSLLRLRSYLEPHCR